MHLHRFFKADAMADGIRRQRRAQALSDYGDGEGAVVGLITQIATAAAGIGTTIATGVVNANRASAEQAYYDTLTAGIQRQQQAAASQPTAGGGIQLPFSIPGIDPTMLLLGGGAILLLVLLRD